MDEPQIIFTLYANHMHSELPRATFRRMLGSELERMIRKVNIPITYSTQGEDIDLYGKLSPQVVDAINENPNVRLARGLYNAVLPTTAHKQLPMQINESDKVVEGFFQGKVEKLRFFPEHDFHPENWEITGKPEPTVILDNVHPYYEYRADLPLPAARIYAQGKHILGLSYENKRVPVLVNKGIRIPYLTYFRGMNNLEDVVKAFEDEMHSAKQNGEPCILFLTDLEVPQLNEINGQSRLDKWEELMSGLKDSEISQYFKHFSDIEDDVTNHVENSSVYTVDRRTLPKWGHSPYSQRRVFDAISEAGKKGLMKSRYFKFVGMHAPFKDIWSWAAMKNLNGKLVSEQDVDYTSLTPEQLGDKVLELPTDKGPKVRITSDNLRLDEFKHFIKTLKTGNNLLNDLENLDPSLQYVIRALHEIYSEK